jgi:hypothetical protein
MKTLIRDCRITAPNVTKNVILKQGQNIELNQGMGRSAQDQFFVDIPSQLTWLECVKLMHLNGYPHGGKDPSVVLITPRPTMV